MKRVIIQTILLCSVLAVLSAETERDCRDLSRICATSVLKMIETGDSFDNALFCYQTFLYTAKINDDELLNTMKDLMTADKAKYNRLLIGLWSGLALIAGIILLYYFKSKRYRKKSNNALASIRDHAAYDLQSRMKNHLMKILYRYKDGVSFCLKQIFEAESPKSAADLTLFEEDMKKADALVDTLLDWVETNPDMKLETSEFDVNEIVRQLVVFYRIGFASKNISYQLQVEKPLIARGDKNMLIIALEHLFHRLTNDAAKNSMIFVSVSKTDSKYATVSISDPENQKPALEKEIFAQRVAELETTGKATQTADWDFNIFAEFTFGNRAKTHIECTPEKGTVYKYEWRIEN